MFKKDYKFFILLFFAVIFYFYALDKYPLVWIDEPWLAEPSFNLAKYGEFINLTFFNYFGKDLLDLQLPFFHLPLALMFKIFGLSVIKARTLSVIFNLLVVILVYYSTKLIYDDNNTAFVAALFLILNPVFFQCARQTRPEAYVTFFTILSFYLFLKAVDTEKLSYYIACGIISAFSLLAHPNGAFVILTLFLIIFFRNKKASLYYLAANFIVLAGWIAYIFANSQIYYLQAVVQFPTRAHSMGNILNNLLTEYKRWLFPSILTPALFGFSALGYLIFTNYAKKECNEKQRLLIIYILIFIATFWLFDKSKAFLYLNLIFSFFAMLVSGAYSEVYKKRKLLAVCLLAAVLFLSGIFLPYKLYKSLPSDYYGVTGKMKEVIPRGSVVIGRPTYWFGLEGYCRLRTYDLPEYYMKKFNPSGGREISYANAVKMIKADYIIFDNSWAHIYRQYQKENENFLKRHCILVKTITDKYYGQESEKKHEPDNIKIYKIK